MKIKEGIGKIIASKNKTLLAFCFSFILGAGIFSWFDWSRNYSAWWFGVVFTVATISILVWHRPRVRFSTLSIFFFLLAAWRVQVVFPDCRDPNALCHDNGRTVTLIGFILDEPTRAIGKTKYIISNITIAGEHENGSLLVTASSFPNFHYGDGVRFTCRLEVPINQANSTFRYDKYLARQGVFSLCRSRRLTPLNESAHGPVTFFFKTIFSFKEWLDMRVAGLWQSPESGLMAGILYGSKSGLPKDVSANFNNTGVTHIVAVSGFNITIIATVLMSVLIAIGLWRRQAYWVAVVSIWLFTILSGLGASAIRAAVMGTIALTAERLGRRGSVGTILIVSAAVMLLANPLLFLWDAGFQLSFLATLGIVYVTPILEKKITWANKWFGKIREPLITTLAAIIATTPLIMYQFGRFSLVAPLVNILVLWVVPWLMLLGFLAVVGSALFFPLGQAIAWFAHLGLAYVIFVTGLFGHQSWSAIDVALPWWGMVLMYFFILWYVKKSSPLRISTRL